MSNSQFCIQQRQKEQRQLKKLLVFGFASSTVIHSILAYALPRWSLESSQVVDKPIEIMIVDKIKPKPKLKVESKPIVEPKTTPVKLPEPIQAKTSPPPVKAPEPIAQTPLPKPVPKTPIPKTTPKKVLTTPTPAPSQPTVSAPVENTAKPPSLSNSLTVPSNLSVTSSEISSDPDASDLAVATNSIPPRPEASTEAVEEIVCINNCKPEYPTTLAGVEGSAGLKLTIDRNGNVMVAELTVTDGNSKVDRQALLAARQMQFSSPGDEPASIRVKIDFTVEGSEYDRARREEQGRHEQAKKERQEQEAARQHQLEAEQQARQEQLEQEQEQARQQQLQQQSTPSPMLETEPAPKPLPTLSPEELDKERLRKFQERMKNY